MSLSLPTVPRVHGRACGRHLAVSATLALAVFVGSSIGAPASALAQTRACDALSPKLKPTAAELLGRLRSYACCDGTIASCVAVKKARCRLAVRLADDVCRQVQAGRAPAAIEAALARRATSMTALGAVTGTFALDEATRAGDAGAPVTVVLYACTRCPFCKTMTEALYREVTAGTLKGKVRLYFRPFPLRDHAGSAEGGIAILAAARLGKFWPMALAVYDHFDDFAADKLSDWAAAVGMDRSAFVRMTGDPSVREALVASKREGLRNKVNQTPTLFIDGRKYVYDLELPVLVDVLGEEHERVTRTERE